MRVHRCLPLSRRGATLAPTLEVRDGCAWRWVGSCTRAIPSRRGRRATRISSIPAGFRRCPPAPRCSTRCAAPRCRSPARIAAAEEAGATLRAARLGLRQPGRPGAGRGVRAHRRADLRRAVEGAGRGATRRRLSRPARRRRRRQLPGRGRRAAAPRARHRRRPAADHQPRSALQPDARDGRRWPTRWCRSAPIRMST